MLSHSTRAINQFSFEVENHIEGAEKCNNNNYNIIVLSHIREEHNDCGKFQLA